jgi:hypothetical protein
VTHALDGLSDPVTKERERQRLADDVAAWLANNNQIEQCPPEAEPLMRPLSPFYFPQQSPHKKKKEKQE